MRNVVAQVAPEDGDEDAHNIVEALEILVARFVLREGIQQLQQVFLLEAPTSTVRYR